MPAVKDREARRDFVYGAAERRSGEARISPPATGPVAVPKSLKDFKMKNQGERSRNTVTNQTSGRNAARTMTALKLACLPAALLLANCNAPAPPAAPAPTVIERIEAPPAVTLQVPVVIGHDNDRRREEEDRRRHEEEQRHHDDHDSRPH